MKKKFLLVAFLGVSFYFSCIHRSREVPKSLKEKGIEVVEKIFDVKISGYGVYNPGVIEHKDGYLIVHREKAKNFLQYLKLKLKRERQNLIMVTELDEHFFQKGDCYKLISSKKGYLDKITDPRLFTHLGNIYMIFCDHTNGGSVQTLSRLEKQEDKWEAKDITPLQCAVYDRFIENGILTRGIEKNWMPFSCDNKLYIVYLWEPEKVILDVDIKSGICKQVYQEDNKFMDDFFPVRGGAPPIYDKDFNGFIHFYHIPYPGRNSFTTIAKNIYIAGAYVFSSKAPFSLMLKTKGPFYQDNLYNNREKIIFPTACIAKKDHFLVFYGEDDIRIKVAKISKQKLLEKMQRSECEISK